ncbi:DUF6248 family natural product biosynthesis protein [Streptomyces vietnamensis]|uniref:Uncharacterized protein n=1 Tax=Streptomyces vietnamensis TaxID=362257 RepID=A0A0B5IPX1_9ACTN|nr:DUF6248 family natural product biosynthesis protein [Streptomyces vietnamensis]AJF70474.1 hypothetical protein SVTN_40665 [Streptomyces vietnamensis]
MNETRSAAGRRPAARLLAGPVIRRPQRTLTPEEREIVRGISTLNFQGALIMGIVDPVPNPSPMDEDEGAWVREQVWSAYLQKIERKYPFGFARWAMCERGTCWNCLAGRCDLCVHRQEGGPHADDNTDWVLDIRGRCVAKFILRPGGEPCVWWCRCACPKSDPTPETAAAPAEGEVAPGKAAGRPGGAVRRGQGSAVDAAQYALF